MSQYTTSMYSGIPPCRQAIYILGRCCRASLHLWHQLYSSFNIIAHDQCTDLILEFHSHYTVLLEGYSMI